MESRTATESFSDDEERSFEPKTPTTPEVWDTLMEITCQIGKSDEHVLLSDRQEEGLMQDFKGIIGARIREERTKRDLKQDMLATAVGIDGPRLSRIERGERGIDTLVLRRVARYFGLPMESFFEPEGAGNLVLARQGDAEDEAMQTMLAYGRRLQRDARFVETEFARRA